MVKKRLTDAVAGIDSKTEQWRMKFAVARMAYEDGNLKEAERLLVRLEEPAAGLKEHTFTVNATRMGLGAVQLASGRLKEAGKNFDKSVSELATSPDPVLKELYAVCLRFRSELLSEQKDERGAE